MTQVSGQALWSGAAAAAGIAGGFAAGLRYSVKSRSSQILGRSIYRGPRNRRTIALTFDDGPSPGSLRLADYLDMEQVPATFFQCGANVERHPEIARALFERGHEIGNHTYSHARLPPRLGWHPNLLSRAEIYHEFASAQQAILCATGAVPRWSRAPYGMRWLGLGRAQRRLGLVGVMWTVIGHDWEWDAERVAAYVLRRAAPGGILCLHDGRDTMPNPDISVTLDAVKRIVPSLKAQGYKFRTLSGMLDHARICGVKTAPPNS